MEEGVRKPCFCVDLFKFICAFLVVSIHIPPFTTCNVLLDYVWNHCITRVAVPFYFISSGYFLFRKTSYGNFDINIPLQYVNRIFKVYVIWTIVYFPYVLKFKILGEGHEGIRVSAFLKWVRDCIFVGSYTQLWYLNATIIATLIITFLVYKRIRKKTILWIAIIMYVIGLLPQTYFGILEFLKRFDFVWSSLKIIEKIIYTTRNGFFEGFLFMVIGMLFAYKPISIKFKMAVIGFLVSMFLFLIEAIYLKYLGWTRHHDMYIFLVPVSFFLFYIVSHIELVPSRIYIHLRKMGILIFYLHLLVAPIVEEGISIIDNMLDCNLNNSFFNYCCVVIITSIISQFIIVLSNVEKFDWLKRMY